MAGLDRLIDIAGRRSDEAVAAWQRLRAQCDEALRKLSLLKEFRNRYGRLMRAGLTQGMPATATMTYLDFIGQIDEVVLRQESDLGALEAGCARRWQELIEARRERRMYEILGERAAARAMAAALRRGQAEIDDLLQRAARII
jgi:flagellar export protein FliJ